MGLVWKKHWKWNEVAGKAASFAAVQQMGCIFAMAQWAGLQLWRDKVGRAWSGLAKQPAPCFIVSWTTFRQVLRL